jgi:hypothetical protein
MPPAGGGGDLVGWFGGEEFDFGLTYRQEGLQQRSAQCDPKNVVVSEPFDRFREALREAGRLRSGW